MKVPKEKAAAADAAAQINKNKEIKMGLFNLGKKKEENNSAECACNCSCSTQSSAGTQGKQAPAASANANELQSVKVLGSGCRNCHTLLENTNAALKNMSVPFEAEYITDMEKVMTYGAMSMPVLVVNERVVSMGKVPGSAEIEKLLHKIGY